MGIILDIDKTVRDRYAGYTLQLCVRIFVYLWRLFVCLFAPGENYVINYYGT